MSNSDDETTPEKALETAISHGYFRQRGAPGEVIQRMSAKFREALKSLTSADIQNVRTDWFLGPRKKR